MPTIKLTYESDVTAEKSSPKINNQAGTKVEDPVVLTSNSPPTPKTVSPPLVVPSPEQEIVATIPSITATVVTITTHCDIDSK